MLRSFACLLSILSPLALADLQPLEEAEMAAVNGQDGISISASIRFNPNPQLTRNSDVIRSVTSRPLFISPPKPRTTAIGDGRALS